MQSQTDSIQTLAKLHSNALPLEYPLQIAYVQNVESMLHSAYDFGFESAAENAYETQIFPAIFQRLSHRQEISVIKRLFRILYDRVRTETMDRTNIIISWLQPPQPMLESAMYGLEEQVLSQYKKMVDSISSSQLSMEGMEAASRNKKWPNQQAFVVGLRCDVEEFCEFFWRLFRSNLSGAFMDNQINSMTQAHLWFFFFIHFCLLQSPTSA